MSSKYPTGHWLALAVLARLTLSTEKLADLVVLDKDYLTVPGDDIGKLTLQLTVFDGRIVYVHQDFSQENNLKPKDATIATYAELIARRKRMTNYSGGG